MRDRAATWVVLDDRPIDRATVAGAVASQSTLGGLLDRLRRTSYPLRPVTAAEEVEP